ncbi:MAG TPA: hypothetical protein PLK41_04600 [Defluviitoga tunisiensis]|nr:hypothetical protein [bacterium]HPP10251.1 hypothetical protein [Defluviitoga tunisiensis]
MRFLVFDKKSQVKFNNNFLGYSRDCVVNFDDKVENFFNQKLSYPVETIITERQVSVSIQLLEYTKIKDLLNSLNSIGPLEIQGILIGKGVDSLPVGKQVKFILYKAVLINYNELNFSDLVNPTFKFIGLYDFVTNKVWDMIEV